MKTERTILINAPADRVWEIMSDVERWHEWTGSITSVEPLQSGPMAVGNRYRVRQPRVPANVWEVTEFVPGSHFRWRNKSPGLLSVGDHRVEAMGSGTKATLGIEQTGLAEPLLRLVYGGMTKRYVDMEAEGLRRRAEETEPGH